MKQILWGSVHLFRTFRLQHESSSAVNKIYIFYCDRESLNDKKDFKKLIEKIEKKIKLFDYFKRIRGNISVKNRLIFVNMKRFKYSKFKITVTGTYYWKVG